MPALYDTYHRDKAALLAPLLKSGASRRDVYAALRQLSERTDDLLRQLWQRARLPAAMALVATGGYGRTQLFPYSDIDVLVLLSDDCSALPSAAVEVFIRSCWDSGLQMGSSVRNIAQCVAEAATNITVQTALLEARLVCGNSVLFGQLRQCCTAQLDMRAFLLAKMLEMRQRHTRYENTPYALEPNCKESPGGLRDLQILLWIARAAGLGHTWHALAANGLVTALEKRQLERNEGLLFLIRARLHLLTGRCEDRLLFDLQTALAASFGWHTNTLPGSGVGKHPSELLMRRYYWAAKAVSQLSHILLLGLQERLHPRIYTLRPLNARFHDRAGLLEVADAQLYQRQPHAILETFLLYQTHIGIKGLSAATLRALYNARSVMDSSFRRDPVNRATFMQIVRQPTRVSHALQLMNQTSVLGRTLWPFRRIVGRMQHDLFHIYTVDQHTLMVVRNIRRFFLAEHAHEYPLCSQLAADWDQPWLLYLGALFHDIGKGHGGDHSMTGAAVARRFCRQHAAWGIDGEAAALVEFLVLEHLTMSQVAQKQDLSDPAVIAAFARRVGTERRLIALYLLTVADIRGTSPKVWSAWKGKLLEDLFHATVRVLGGHTPHPAAEIASRKQQALVLCRAAGAPCVHQCLWNTLHVSYFMRHDAADIAWHTQQLWHCVDSNHSVVRVRPSLAGEGLQVLVYAQDQPELFARICGWLDSAHFSIVDARIHTTQKGYALDTFQVHATVLGISGQALIQHIESQLPQAIDSATVLPTPTRRSLSRRAKNFPIAPHVTLRPDEKAQRWLIHLTANDRAGLLYTIACVLAHHGLSVELAKISTLGERVEDHFLVYGSTLQDNAVQIQLETELLQVLAGNQWK